MLWSPIGQFTPSCLPLDVEPVNLRGYFGSFEVARRGWQRYSVWNMEAKHRWYPRNSRPEPWKSPLWPFTASLSCFWRSASESCWPGSRRTDAVWPTCSNTRSIGWGARLIFLSTPRHLPFPQLQAAGCVAAEAAPSTISASIYCLNLNINDRFFLSSSDLLTPAKIRPCFLFFHSPVLGGLCVAHLLGRLNLSADLAPIATHLHHVSLPWCTEATKAAGNVMQVFLCSTNVSICPEVEHSWGQVCSVRVRLSKQPFVVLYDWKKWVEKLGCEHRTGGGVQREL